MNDSKPKLSDLLVSKDQCCLCKEPIKNRASSYFIMTYCLCTKKCKKVFQEHYMKFLSTKEYKSSTFTKTWK